MDDSTYLTILEWCKHHGILGSKDRDLGKEASKFCKGQGIHIVKVNTNHPVYKNVNSYPKWVLDRMFNNLIPKPEKSMAINIFNKREQPSALEELITNWPDEDEPRTESKRHKHYDCIVAWAEGEKIQYEHRGNWCDIDEPDWYEDVNYRIKPKLIKHSGWINIYRDDHMNVSPDFFFTKDLADKFSESRVACIHVEWEEEE